MRIAVIGHSASGKSTLARFLGEAYGIPVMHLDRVHFLPGWKERDNAEARDIVAGFMQRDDWVIDGNYTGFLYDDRMEMADIIIYMRFSRVSCLRRAAVRRAEYGGKTRESMAEGCREKMDLEFIMWILRGGRTREKLAGYGEICQRYAHKTVIIRNQRELDGYMERIGKRIHCE